eukprot:SAG11_NODE_18099_length_500_cov_0.553616_2_plen_107_part_00
MAAIYRENSVCMEEYDEADKNNESDRHGELAEYEIEELAEYEMRASEVAILAPVTTRAGARGENANTSREEDHDMNPPPPPLGREAPESSGGETSHIRNGGAGSNR